MTAFVEKFAEDQRVMYSLVNHFGWQEGEKLGSWAARELVGSGRPWMYDRSSGLVLDVRQAHPVVAAMLYAAYKKCAYRSELGDAYVDEGMGFWLSSVSVKTRRVMLGAEVKLSVPERMAFSAYEFVRI